MNIDELAHSWRSAGIREGDLLLVHSDTRRLLRASLRQGTRLTADAILESFRRAVGSEGTLLMPLFNFGFTRGVPFDIRSTPSQMGALTEAARLHPEAVRTGHPVYSFAALGRQAGLFAGVDNRSAYGAESPFGILHRAGGRIAVLDLPDNVSMTFYHYVEEVHAVPYRYQKDFTAPYTDAQGNTCPKTYSLYVRDVDAGVVTYAEPVEQELWKNGLYTGDRPGEGNGLRSIEAARLYDYLSAVITSGRAENNLYRIERKADG